MDVVTAFLNGNLEKETYNRMPAYFRDAGRPTLVYRLLKGFYALKQDSKRSYAKTQDFLIVLLKSKNYLSELCLCTMRKRRIFLCVILYVDDLLTSSYSCAEFLHVNAELSSHFRMNDLEPARQLLGIRSIRDHPKRSLFLY